MLVVPLVGTWIETLFYLPVCKLYNRVVPLVGTWIETYLNIFLLLIIRSFPSWERGLKLLVKGCRRTLRSVVPLVGTWIETLIIPSCFPHDPGRSPRGNVD